MELTNEQWNRIESIIFKTTPVKDPRGRETFAQPLQILMGWRFYFEVAPQ